MNWLTSVLTKNNPFVLARLGDFEKIKSLIEAKPILLNQKDKNGESLLHKVAGYGHLDICKYLISKGIPVDIEIPDAKATPLMMAVSFNNFEVVEYLLSVGANINKQDLNGVSSMHYAVSRNLLKMASLLKSKHADLDLKDKIGRTPLDIAKEKEFAEIKNLLEA